MALPNSPSIVPGGPAGWRNIADQTAFAAEPQGRMIEPLPLNRAENGPSQVDRGAEVAVHRGPTDLAAAGALGGECLGLHYPARCAGPRWWVEPIGYGALGPIPRRRVGERTANSP